MMMKFNMLSRENVKNKSLKVDHRVIDYLIKNQTRDLKKIVEIIA